MDYDVPQQRLCGCMGISENTGRDVMMQKGGIAAPCASQGAGGRGGASRGGARAISDYAQSLADRAARAESHASPRPRRTAPRRRAGGAAHRSRAANPALAAGSRPSLDDRCRFSTPTSPPSPRQLSRMVLLASPAPLRAASRAIPAAAVAAPQARGLHDLVIKRRTGQPIVRAGPYGGGRCVCRRTTAAAAAAAMKRQC
jgi:hypothetical protein